MKVNETELIQIKKTKSVEMYYDEENDIIRIYVYDENRLYKDIDVPISKAFQLKRGLESAVQRFYRRKKR